MNEKSASERIKKYLEEWGVDSDRSVQETAGVRLYELGIRNNDQELIDGALKIWRQLGIPESKIKFLIEEAEIDAADDSV